MRSCDKPRPVGTGLQCLTIGRTRGLKETAEQVCKSQICPGKLSIILMFNYIIVVDKLNVSSLNISSQYYQLNRLKLDKLR